MKLKHKQAAEYLQISPRTLHDLGAAKLVARENVAKPGSKRPMWRYTPVDLDAYAARGRVPAIADESASAVVADPAQLQVTL